MKATAAILESVAKLEAQGRVVERRPVAAVPIADRVNEAEFQSEVIAFATRHGWRHYHTHDSRKSVSGFPDLILIRGPVLLVAELKVGDNEPTADQLTWLEAFAAAGVQTFVWRPSDWPMIARLLEGAT
jgi:hypothetical protein